MPFAIGDAQRDAWFHHMAEAVHGGNLDPADEQEMLADFVNVAACTSSIGPDRVVDCSRRQLASDERDASAKRFGRCGVSGPVATSEAHSSVVTAEPACHFDTFFRSEYPRLLRVL